MAGEIRSCFAMTEPAVASSDATNIQTEIRRDGDDYVINGRKWWITGAPDPRCKISILMGKTDPGGREARQQSMVLVPMDTPGITIVRPLTVFGYDDAPHGHAEIVFENVRVPASNILLGEGRGFEIAQGRLGPGPHPPLHALDRRRRAGARDALHRALTRHPFGKSIAEQGVTRHWIAESRMEIDQARLLTLQAAHMMDTVGNKARPGRDRDDQGRGPERRLQGRRPGHPGLRRRRHEPGFPPRGRLRAFPHAPHGRRPGRGASRDGRQDRAAQARGGEHAAPAAPGRGIEGTPACSTTRVPFPPAAPKARALGSEGRIDRRRWLRGKPGSPISAPHLRNRHAREVRRMRPW